MARRRTTQKVSAPGLPPAERVAAFVLAAGLLASGLLVDTGAESAFDASWSTPNGAVGLGEAVALTGDTGYFWFFNSANVEIIIKVLNGCGINANYRVFAGGLTNVEVAITVTDTTTGTYKTYFNPQGTAFQPQQDTKAITNCP